MEVGAVTPMTAQATQLFALHNRSGNSGRDFSSIIELLTRKPA
jgi:3-hydroxyisobutyrate dehydrogenase